MKIPASLQALRARRPQFPWRGAAVMLHNRFRDERMGLTASSLTFTTSIALVPSFTVALAVFTAFPMFSQLQGALQGWLVKSLIPDHIARQVMGYLTQFSGQASKLGGAGLAVLLATAIALILTIDRTLNSIWRVKNPRPLAQRLLIYWAGITLGPLVLAASLAATSYVVSASSGLVGVGTLPVSLRFLLDVAQFFLVAGAMAALYRCVPNTYVHWLHALVGGVFVAAGLEIGKRVLGFYLTAVPTYSLVYGAFAALPILLVWIYVSWVIVLMGAVLTASLPSLLAGAMRQGGAPGWPFQLAIEILQLLDHARGTERIGLGASELSRRLQVELLQLEPVLETLVAMDWVGQLSDASGAAESRYLLLVDPQATRLEPLMARLLISPAPALDKLWQKASWRRLCLRDAL